MRWIWNPRTQLVRQCNLECLETDPRASFIMINSPVKFDGIWQFLSIFVYIGLNKDDDHTTLISLVKYVFIVFFSIRNVYGHTFGSDILIFSLQYFNDARFG